MSDVFAHHPRDWRSNLYVYPVISRRSRGLSIGVNLNPDTACNFDCIYCQVDRTQPVRVRDVDLDVLRAELSHMLALATSGAIFDEPQFGAVPQSLRRINDIAFSGDGEPTTCPVFAEAVQLAADLKAEHGVPDVLIVLITDACYLTKPAVERGLAIMDNANGEIWAKLDAGTQPYYELINRPNYPLTHVMQNIIAAALARSIRVQSLFMRVNGEAPSDAELEAYVGRLREITSAGGKIHEVQIYTVARQPAESYVTALSNETLDAIVARVRSDAKLAANAYYASSD
ncbi:MAG: radical SAM protein [Phycisphaerales bacterium]|nr:radical SAM protein [Phycisphaerales bacterium]